MMNIKQFWFQLFIFFWIKNTSGKGIKNENMSNKKLEEKLNK